MLADEPRPSYVERSSIIEIATPIPDEQRAWNLIYTPSPTGIRSNPGMHNEAADALL